MENIFKAVKIMKHEVQVQKKGTIGTKKYGKYL